MKALLRWLTRKGITTDAFVIVLLVVGLAVAIGVLVYFITRSNSTAGGLFNLTSGLK